MFNVSVLCSLCIPQYCFSGLHIHSHLLFVLSLLWSATAFHSLNRSCWLVSSWEAELKTEIWKGTSWLKVRVRFTGLKSTHPQNACLSQNFRNTFAGNKGHWINRYSQDDVILESRGPLVSHDWYPYKKRRRHLGRMPGKTEAKAWDAPTS